MFTFTFTFKFKKSFDTNFLYRIVGSGNCCTGTALGCRYLDEAVFTFLGDILREGCSFVAVFGFSILFSLVSTRRLLNNGLTRNGFAARFFDYFFGLPKFTTTS